MKLIVFDLWQTLAYRDVNYGITSEILRLFHPSLSKRKAVKVFENSIQTKKWKIEHKTVKWGSEYKAFEKLSKSLGIGTNEETVRLLMALRDYSDSRVKLYPYVLGMLKKLKRSYKIGLLSNSSVFDVKYVKSKTSLFRYIDFSLFSFDVGVVKPDVKFFRFMLKKSGCRPEEVLMIGDKYGDDVLPARKVGMEAIHYKNYKQLKKDFLRYNIKI